MTSPARFCRAAALTALAGAVVSGPVALGVVQALRPQPPWRDADTFAAAWHPLQALPYVAGFLLVGGFVALIAALHQMAAPAHRGRTGAAAAFAAVFAAMIVLNYVLQTTVVPVLIAGDAAARSLAGWITMVNPGGIGWALEMWGYAVLGVATWLVAPVFAGPGRDAWTRALWIANGPFSVAGGVLTAAQPGWVLTGPGLAAFGLWNLLVVAMLWLAVTWPGRVARGGTEG